MKFLLLVFLLTFLDQSKAAKIQANAVIFEDTDFSKPGALAKVLGNIEFEQENDKLVTVKGQLAIPTGEHGFHIHALGDYSTDCKAAKCHFNPEHKVHGGPDAKIRHVGDLGNVKSVNNVAKISITDSMIKLIGPHSIIGRAVVVHKNADDLGQGGHPDSNTTGHAGPRIGCGIIGVSSADYNPEKKEIAVKTKIQAKAVIFSNTNFSNGAQGKVLGIITFEQETDKDVTVKGQLVMPSLEIPSGKHGFHIHALGDYWTNCGAAKGHFNPEHKDHGAPEDTVRHVGDLGNVLSDSGVAKIDKTDSMIKLIGPHSIIGRAVVVHKNADDLGKGGKPDSKTTGHAGPRIGCGIIGVSSVDYNPSPMGTPTITTTPKSLSKRPIMNSVLIGFCVVLIAFIMHH